MKTLYLILGLSLFLTACGATGTGGGNSGSNITSGAAAASLSKLDVKIGGKDSTLNVASGVVNPSEMISTAPGKPNLKTSAHTIYIANYELDASSPGWMNKPLTAPDQMRVELQLTGEDGSGKDSPFKVGTYAAQADKINGVRFVRIRTFTDGKPTDASFDSLMGYKDKKAAGEVKITSVTADAVSGEMDLTEGDKSIKGNFTAKLPAAKK
jgi:hypothetical protein